MQRAQQGADEAPTVAPMQDATLDLDLWAGDELIDAILSGSTVEERLMQNGAENPFGDDDPEVEEAYRKLADALAPVPATEASARAKTSVAGNRATKHGGAQQVALQSMALPSKSNPRRWVTLLIVGCVLALSLRACWKQNSERAVPATLNQSDRTEGSSKSPATTLNEKEQMISLHAVEEMITQAHARWVNAAFGSNKEDLLAAMGPLGNVKSMFTTRGSVVREDRANAWPKYEELRRKEIADVETAQAARAQSSPERAAQSSADPAPTVSAVDRVLGAFEKAVLPEELTAEAAVAPTATSDLEEGPTADEDSDADSDSAAVSQDQLDNDDPVVFDAEEEEQLAATAEALGLTDHVHSQHQAKVAAEFRATVTERSKVVSVAGFSASHADEQLDIVPEKAEEAPVVASEVSATQEVVKEPPVQAAVEEPLSEFVGSTSEDAVREAFAAPAGPPGVAPSASLPLEAESGAPSGAPLAAVPLAASPAANGPLAMEAGQNLIEQGMDLLAQVVDETDPAQEESFKMEQMPPVVAGEKAKEFPDGNKVEAEEDAKDDDPAPVSSFAAVRARLMELQRRANDSYQSQWQNIQERRQAAAKTRPRNQRQQQYAAAAPEEEDEVGLIEESLEAQAEEVSPQVVSQNDDSPKPMARPRVR